MRKRIMILAAMVLVAAVLTGFSFSKGYESSKTREGYAITLKAAKYPLVKGDNEMTVLVADGSGKAVSGAAVEVRYYMPPMPGMAPMDYRVKAAPKGGEYVFLVNIPMEGGWRIEVSVTPASGKAVSAIFNLDAR